MAYISLYRKYRPKKFSDVVGQDIVVKILKNSIIEKKIGHAYIFAGPRGIGKTSIAKIFSKAVNCLDPIDGDLCGKCESCIIDINNDIDIVEIDAASNNGVEEIREIRNNIRLMPTKLKYKVYIIDEVHMLSISAFNALLKTLEEPPAHAIFILATTEINKIPNTVISRCQKFDFEKIPPELIENQLNYILKQENKFISKDVINFIAKMSDGGMRDAINMLDQVIALNNENVAVDDVYKLLGEVTNDELFKIMDNIFNQDMLNVINIVNTLYEKGSNFDNICNKLQILIRDILIYKNSKKYFDEEYEKILNKYSKYDNYIYINICDELFSLSTELKRTPNQRLLIEIYFIKIILILNNNLDIKESQHESLINDESLIKKDYVLKIKKIRVNNALCGAKKELKNDFVENFSSIDEFMSSKKYNALASILKKAKVEVVSENNIIFSYNNNFDVVIFDKNMNEIDQFVSKAYKKKYKTVCVTTNEWNKIKNEYISNVKKGIKYTIIDENERITNKKNNELERTLDNIFGDKYIKVD